MKEFLTMFGFFSILCISLLSCGEKKIYTPGLSWDREVKSFNWNEAMEYCKNKKMFLPSKEELISGFNSKKKELLAKKGSFWSASSTVDSDNYAWVVDYSTGKAFLYNKDYYYYVRCVAR